MNWIKNEYLSAAPFYLIFGALWAYFNPLGVEQTGEFWPEWLATVLGAYTFLTIYIVIRILWATFTHKKSQ